MGLPGTQKPIKVVPTEAPGEEKEITVEPIPSTPDPVPAEPVKVPA